MTSSTSQHRTETQEDKKFFVRQLCSLPIISKSKFDDLRSFAAKPKKGGLMTNQHESRSRDFSRRRSMTHPFDVLEGQ
jgi:hypothetical protein